KSSTMCVFRRVRTALVPLLAVLCAIVLPASAGAQQAAQTPVPSGPLSLEQVLEIAAVRSEGIGIAQAGVRRAAGDQVRARSGLFPQLTLSAGYDRALASEFSDLFNNVSTPGTGGDAAEADLSKLPFGRANTWRLSLAFSQNLY